MTTTVTPSFPASPCCPRCASPLAADAPEGLCPRCLAAINFGGETFFTGGEASLPPPPVEEIAPHFPQLEILSCLGRGGMGVVYKARQISLDRFVALKLLAPEREKDPEFSERFAREAQALARMSHPHIVTVHDFGQAGGFFHLLMEYVDGPNLRHLLQSHKFTPEQALGIVPPLCDALQYAHDRGIVHRDIKPENLLIDRDGHVKVADFGLAKMLGTEAGDERPMGTPSYMAPEQAGNPAQVDNRADIYSLGVVIYEMLTGELPVQNFQPPSKVRGVDSRLDDVVSRAMEQEPDKRYAQASILKTEVQNITSTPGAVPPHTSPSSAAAVPFYSREVAPQDVGNTVGGPAIGMMVTSGLSLLLGVPGILAFLFAGLGASRFAHSMYGGPFGGFAMGVGGLALLSGFLWMLVSCAASVVAFFGANRMRKMESWRWSLAAALILLVEGVLSLPSLFSGMLGGLLILAKTSVGIWALITLNRPGVRAAFTEPERPFPVISTDWKLAVPAWGLIGGSLLNLLGLAVVTMKLLDPAERLSVGIVLGLGGCLVFVLMVLVTLAGAWSLLTGKRRTLVIIGSVLAILTPPGFLLGAVFGIWALVAVSGKGGREHFTKDPGNPESGSTGRWSRPVLAIVVAGLAILLVPVLLLLLVFPLTRSHSRRPMPVTSYSVPAAPVSRFPELPTPPAWEASSRTSVIPGGLATDDDLSARIEASSRISDIAMRAATLSTIAIKAAESGNTEQARHAIGHIADMELYDRTSREAAMVLGGLGQPEDALSIARGIRGIEVRNQVLAELATKARGAVDPDVATQAGADVVAAGQRMDSSISAALQINDISLRDTTLSALAKEASSTGLPEHALRVARMISLIPLRDETLAEAAGNLARSGKRTEAVKIAGEISLVELRDKTLASLLASGTPGGVPSNVR